MGLNQLQMEMVVSLKLIHLVLVPMVALSLPMNVTMEFVNASVVKLMVSALALIARKQLAQRIVDHTQNVIMQLVLVVALMDAMELIVHSHTLFDRQMKCLKQSTNPKSKAWMSVFSLVFLSSSICLDVVVQLLSVLLVELVFS